MRGIRFVVAFCLFAVPVAAQPRPRVEIAAGAALQPATASFAAVRDFPYFAETARVEGAYDVADGVAFDITGAVRVWRSLAVRIGGTRLTRNTESQTHGSFPHPFFFGMNRTGTWPSGSLDRTELGAHLSADWALVQTPRFGVSLFGGPTWFNFTQAVVDRVEVIQSYPYDTIDARLTTGTVKGSALGFHAGADVGWFFSRYLGVGGLIRFTNGSKKSVRIADGNPFDLELGGFQGGGGVRLRF
jgi:hypothetical protein